MSLIKCLVTNIIDPHNLWCHIGTEESFAHFEAFEEQIHQFAENSAKENKFADVENLKNGRSVLAYASRHKKWRRAVVHGVESDDAGVEVDVLFPDYQYSEQLALTQVLDTVPDWIIAYPAQATRCALVDVAPLASAWVPRCLQFLNENLLAEVVDAELVASRYEHNIPIYDIDILIEVNGEPRSVSELLIEKLFAVHDPSPREGRMKATVPKFNVDRFNPPYIPPVQQYAVEESGEGRDYEKEAFCAGRDTDMTDLQYTDMHVGTASDLISSVNPSESISQMIEDLKSNSNELTEHSSPSAGNRMGTGAFGPIGSGSSRTRSAHTSGSPDSSRMRHISPAGSTGSRGSGKESRHRSESGGRNAMKTNSGRGRFDDHRTASPGGRGRARDNRMAANFRNPGPDKREIPPRFRQNIGGPPPDYAYPPKPHAPPKHWTERSFENSNRNHAGNSYRNDRNFPQRDYSDKRIWEPRRSDSNNWRENSTRIDISKERSGSGDHVSNSETKTRVSKEDLKQNSNERIGSDTQLNDNDTQNETNINLNESESEIFSDWNGEKMPPRWSDWPTGNDSASISEITSQVEQSTPQLSNVTSHRKEWSDETLYALVDQVFKETGEETVEKFIPRLQQLLDTEVDALSDNESRALIYALSRWSVENCAFKIPCAVLKSISTVDENFFEDLAAVLQRLLESFVKVASSGREQQFWQFSEFLAALFVETKDWKGGATITNDIMKIVMKWAVLDKHKNHPTSSAIYEVHVDCLSKFLQHAGVHLDQTRSSDMAEILESIKDQLLNSNVPNEVKEKLLQLLTDHYERKLKQDSMTIATLQRVVEQIRASKELSPTSVHCLTQTVDICTRDIGTETDIDFTPRAKVEYTRVIDQSDPYCRVQEMLQDLKLLDLLNTFVDNGIRDSVLDQDPADLKELLKECGVKPGQILEIKTYVANKKSDTSFGKVNQSMDSPSSFYSSRDEFNDPDVYPKNPSSSPSNASTKHSNQKANSEDTHDQGNTDRSHQNDREQHSFSRVDSKLGSHSQSESSGLSAGNPYSRQSSNYSDNMRFEEKQIERSRSEPEWRRAPEVTRRPNPEMNKRSDIELDRRMGPDRNRRPEPERRSLRYNRHDKPHPQSQKRSPRSEQNYAHYSDSNRGINSRRSNGRYLSSEIPPQGPAHNNQRGSFSYQEPGYSSGRPHGLPYNQQPPHVHNNSQKLYPPSEFVNSKTRQQEMLEDSFTPKFVLKQLSDGDEGQNSSQGNVQGEINSAYNESRYTDRLPPNNQNYPHNNQSSNAPNESPVDFFTPAFERNREFQSNEIERQRSFNSNPNSDENEENCDRRLSDGTDNSENRTKRYNRGGFKDVVSDWLSHNESQRRSPPEGGKRDFSKSSRRGQMIETRRQGNHGLPSPRSYKPPALSEEMDQNEVEQRANYHVNPDEYPSLSESRSSAHAQERKDFGYPATSGEELESPRTLSMNYQQQYRARYNIPDENYPKQASGRFGMSKRVCHWCGSHEHSPDSCPQKSKNLFL